MKIRNFLEDLEKQDIELTNKAKVEEDRVALEKQQKADYIKQFGGYYETMVVPKIEHLKTELGTKFELTYDSEIHLQQHGVYEANVKIIPNFGAHIQTLTINIIAEETRKLITLSGDWQNAKGQRIGDGVFRFQDSLEKFSQLDLEAEFFEILEKTFIRK